jgi:hypothetical protein
MGNLLNCIGWACSLTSSGWCSHNHSPTDALIPPLDDGAKAVIYCFFVIKNLLEKTKVSKHTKTTRSEFLVKFHDTKDVWTLLEIVLAPDFFAPPTCPPSLVASCQKRSTCEQDVIACTFGSIRHSMIYSMAVATPLN